MQLERRPGDPQLCHVKFREAGLLNASRIMEKNTPDVADFVADEKAEKTL